MIKYTISICILFLTFTSLLAQSNSDFKNIVLDDSFQGKNLHEVLMDVNASKLVFIAYDVNAASKIKVHKNYFHQPLSTLLDDLVESDIQKVDQAKYLIQFEKKDIPKQENIQFISGIVTDVEKQPIPYALISVDSKNAVYANEYGEFKIKVNVPKNKLFCANMLGFKTLCLNFLEENDPLIFILEEDPIELEAVVLNRSPIKAKIKDGNFEIQMNKFLKQNSIGGDILRTIHILPSLHSNNDLNADVQFRNTYVEENLVQYENIPLFMTTHMYGFFSSINNLAVDKISVFPNNVPVEYVSRTGGMLLLENDLSINSTKIPWNFNLDVDFLAAKGAISFVDKKNSFKLTGRTSLGSISNSNFYSLATQQERLLDQNKPIRLLNPKFKFKDFTLYYQHRFNSIWSMNISAIRIEDENSYDFKSKIRIPIKKDTPGNRDSTDLNRIITEGNEISQNGLGLTLKANWSKNWTSSLEFTASKYSELDTIETKTIQKTKHKDRVFSEQFNYQNTLGFYRLQLSQIYKSSSKHKFFFGINLEKYNTVIVNSTKINPPFRPERVVSNTFHSEDLDFSGFATWEYLFTDQFSIKTSTKTTYNTKLKKPFFSPRIQFLYSPTDHLNISLNGQSNYQILRKIYTENPFGKPQNFWTSANENKIAPISSKSFSLNANFQNEDWLFTNSLYFRQSDGITEWININPGYRKDSTIRAQGPALNFFTGQSRGVGFESLISKRTGNLQTWISYRLSKSVEKFPKLYGGNWIPSADDQRHNLHFVTNYKYDNWNAELAYQYGSGRRYLDISNFAPNKKRQKLSAMDFSQLPDYHRLDFSISHEWKNVIKNSNFQITASIYNILDISNSYYRQYPLLIPTRDGEESVATGTDFNQLGRFFDLRVEVGF